MNQARPEADKLVFIVDDDDSIRDMWGFLLRTEGYRVDLFSNGRELLAELHRYGAPTPDAIVLDLMMPEVGGFEVIKELQTGDERTIPLLMVTGRHGPVLESLRAEPNVAACLNKPFKPEELTTSLRSVLKLG